MPEQSWAPEVWASKLPATTLFRSVDLPEMPPPEPRVSSAPVLFVIVTLLSCVSLKPPTKMPPPELPLVLALIVELVMLRTPAALGNPPANIAPPRPAAWLPLIVVPVMVTVPPLSASPPPAVDTVLSRIVLSLTERLACAWLKMPPPS